MEIAILCVGTHGDVRPFVAVGVELAKLGHNVRIISEAKAEAFCREWGLDFAPIEWDLSSLITDPTTFNNKRTVFEKIAFVRQLVNLLNSSLDRQFDVLKALIKEVDVILYHSAIIAAYCLADYFNETLKIPTYGLFLQTDIVTKFHAHCLFPPKLPFGRAGNYMSYLLTSLFFWMPIHKKINGWRKNHFGTFKINWLGPQFTAAYFKKMPIFIGVSPTIVPHPPDWGQHVQMHGFCRLHAKEGWQPSEQLMEFLHKPTIYLGFGSLSVTCPRPILEKIMEAIESSGQRAIISAEFSGVQEMKLSSQFHVASNVPHDWLFPKVAAIIHHGGAGTSAASFHAGKPTFILPFLLDQYHWGHRTHRLGVGPKPLPINKFNLKDFSHRLQDLVQNPAYRVQASSLAEKLACEDGAKKIADQIIASTASRQGQADGNPVHAG